MIRVLTRFYGIFDDISKTSSVNRIRQLAQDLLPDEESWIVNEALIELGATICQRKANCNACPLKNDCRSFQHKCVDQIPYNSRKIKIERLYRSVAVIQYEGAFLVKRGKKGKIMSDLYEFPYFELSSDSISNQSAIEIVSHHLPFQLVHQAALSEVDQSFTRYQAKLFPNLYTCSQFEEVDGMVWISFENLQKLAFSSGHRKILSQLNNKGQKGH